MLQRVTVYCAQGIISIVPALCLTLVVPDYLTPVNPLRDLRHITQTVLISTGKN